MHILQENIFGGYYYLYAEVNIFGSNIYIYILEPVVFLVLTNGITISPAAQAQNMGLVFDAFLSQTSPCIL